MSGSSSSGGLSVGASADGAPVAASPAQHAGESNNASTINAGSFDLVDAKGTVVGEFGKDGKPVAPKVMITQEKEKEFDPVFDEPMPVYERDPEFDEQINGMRQITDILNAHYGYTRQGKEAQEQDPFADAPANPKSVSNSQNSFDKEALGRVAAARANDRADAEKTLGLNSIEVDTQMERMQFAVDKESDRQASMQQDANAGNASRQPDQTKTGNKVESDEIFTAEESDRQKVVPPEVEQKYLRVGNKFYHSTNTSMVAFEDKGNKLETSSNSESIAESMVRIAQARGWDEIKVSGSETFRKEAWLEAASRGMHVRGHTPSEQDKAELAKRLPQKEIDKENASSRAREKEVSAPPFERDSSADGSPKIPQLAGVLLEHGRANYNFDENEKKNYFVKFRDDNGKEKIVWGVDLARAVAESKAHVGQRIELENKGRQAFSVDVPVRHPDGKVAFEKKETHRNSWEVKADAFRTHHPTEVIQKHRELAGVYAAMASVDKQAEADGFTQQQREIIAARVRQNAVNSIERGHLPDVSIKEQLEVEQERVTEREQSR